MTRTRQLALTTTAVSVAALVIVGPAQATPRSASPRAASGPTAPGTFTALQPQRIVDTRSGLGGSAIPARGTTSVSVTGKVGVPASVGAVTLSVTVIGGQSGVLTVYSAGSPEPATSNVNFVRGVPVSNQVIVAPGADGRVTFASNSSRTAQLIVDVEGYYQPGAASTPGGFVPTTPARILDTRTDGGAVPAFGTTPVVVTGEAVPADAAAVVLNLTATGAAASGYLSMFPHSKPRPPSSTLNFRAGATVANLVVAKIGDFGRVDVYNHSSRSTQLVVDVLGYYRGGTPAEPGAFVAQAPTRNYVGRLGADDVNIVDPVVLPTSGDNAAAFAINLTVTRQTAASFATVSVDTFDGGGDYHPPQNTSTVNYQRGVTIAGAAVARELRPDPAGPIALYNRAGSITAIVDVSGYFLKDTATAGNGGISGHVIAGDGSTYAGVVTVYPPPPYGGGDVFPVGAAPTDSAGDYRVLDLPPGDYVVCVVAANYCWRDTTFYPEYPAPDSTLVPVVGAAETRVNIRLPKA